VKPTTPALVRRVRAWSRHTFRRLRRSAGRQRLDRTPPGPRTSGPRPRSRIRDAVPMPPCTRYC